jgi:hypothetical protein
VQEKNKKPKKMDKDWKEIKYRLFHKQFIIFSMKIFKNNFGGWFEQKWVFNFRLFK